VVSKFKKKGEDTPGVYFKRGMHQSSSVLSRSGPH